MVEIEIAYGGAVRRKEGCRLSTSGYSVTLCILVYCTNMCISLVNHTVTVCRTRMES